MKSIAETLNDRTYTDYYYRLMLIARSVFQWDNLPNNINEKWIERYLFLQGECMFFKDKNLGLMAAKCGEMELNHYDEPIFLTPNATNYFNPKMYENGVDCVLIRNNDEMIPTCRSIKLYAYRLTDITRTIDINISAQKTPVLIVCNDKQKLTLKNIFKQWNGFEPVIYGDKDLDLNGVKVLKTDAPIVFPQLQIEKNHIWNECMTFLGVNNANMDKRERLVDDEVQANDEQIELYAQVAYKARKKAAEAINAMFGTNISVKFNSAWEINEREEEAAIEHCKDLVKGVRNVRTEMDVPPSRKAKIFIVSDDAAIRDTFDLYKEFYVECKHCGELVPKDDGICDYCGAIIEEENEEEPFYLTNKESVVYEKEC